MQETRRQRLQSVILEEVSRLVSREIKDPRILPLTFTACEVTQDADQATLFFTLFGSMVNTASGSEPSEDDEEFKEESKRKIKGCLEGLNSAQGFLRKHLGKILNVRHIPNLIFKEDRGITNSTRVRELLQQIDHEKKSQNPKEADTHVSDKSDS